MPGFDFPNSPTNGQQVTGAGNQVYTFDGTKWQASGAGLNQATADARYVNVSGDTMAGDLILAADPTASLQAATRHYVDNAINLAGNYLGTWSVAANTPSISAGGGIANANYVAVTVNPGVAETAPVGIPGIAGQSINNGDRIIWASGLSVWQILRGAGAVSSFNTRTGAVTLNNTDVTTVLPASSTTPTMDGAAAVGAGTTWARADHVHPVDTSRYAATNPSGYQTAAQVNTAVSAAVAGQANVGRNLIHNAAFTVAQRGAGPWTTSVYTVDRWLIVPSLDTMTASQAALSDADRSGIGDEAAISCFSCAFTGNAGAAAFSVLQQHIENVRRLAGKTVTISFSAVASGAGIKLGISADQNFGSGGSPSAAVNGTGQAVSLTTAWARYSVTLVLPSTSGKTLGTNQDSRTTLDIWYSSGANQATRAGSIGVQSGTINLWGVQLEIGSVATPLEKRDPVYEVQQCMRFYEVGFFQLGGSASGAGAGVSYQQPHAVPKRAMPTMIATPGVVANVTGNVITPSSAYSFLVYAVTAGAGGYTWSGNFTASADL